MRTITLLVLSCRGSNSSAAFHRELLNVLPQSSNRRNPENYSIRSLMLWSDLKTGCPFVHFEKKKKKNLYTGFFHDLFVRKVDGPDTIEFHILPQTPKGKELIQLRRHKIKSVRAESQGDSSFPADCHQVIINKMNTKSKKNIKRTNIDN